MSEHQNGYAVMDAPPLADDIPIHLERLTYGDLKRFRKAQGTPEGEDIFDELLDKVIEGGVDNLPITQVMAVTRRLTTMIQEAMSGKAQPAELSTLASDAA